MSMSVEEQNQKSHEMSNFWIMGALKGNGEKNRNQLDILEIACIRTLGSFAANAQENGSYTLKEIISRFSNNISMHANDFIEMIKEGEAKMHTFDDESKH